MSANNTEVYTVILKNSSCSQNATLQELVETKTEQFISTVSFIENVALRGKATQSTTTSGTTSVVANNAIDGNRESNMAAGSCTHTDTQDNPWWRLDLLEPYIVTSMIITNRGDCCAERIDGAEIHVGNYVMYNGLLNPV